MTELEGRAAMGLLGSALIAAQIVTGIWALALARGANVERSVVVAVRNIHFGVLGVFYVLGEMQTHPPIASSAPEIFPSLATVLIVSVALETVILALFFRAGLLRQIQDEDESH